MNPKRKGDAESETLSLTEVKNQLRITGTDSDDALRLFIAAMRHEAETRLGKTLVTTTWQFNLDAFSSVIYLPMGPIQSITTIDYVDTDGATQTLASSGYQFDAGGRLKPSYGNSWPGTRDQFDAVTITYVAGQTHAGNVQEDIKWALLSWVGACEINRENNVIGVTIAEIPNSAKSILAPYRTIKL